MAPFYQTLLLLRRNNKALAADASYRKLNHSNNNVFAYLREANGNKVVVLLNCSNKEQSTVVKDAGAAGKAKNVFINKKVKIKKQP
ncbi:MAG: hypothetical protein EAZ07_03510 [Cytophagales bacterium]|nr:MAG: hypothetical protein EAZ07_03510 [Cytophagales bacterium]